MLQLQGNWSRRMPKCRSRHYVMSCQLMVAMHRYSNIAYISSAFSTYVPIQPWSPSIVSNLISHSGERQLSLIGQCMALGLGIILVNATESIAHSGRQHVHVDIECASPICNTVSSYNRVPTYISHRFVLTGLVCFLHPSGQRCRCTEPTAITEHYSSYHGPGPLKMMKNHLITNPPVFTRP